MNINTKATGITITPSISEYVEKKVGMLEKFFRGAGDVLVNVEVGKTTKHHKSGSVFRAEIQIMAQGQDYYASVEKDDLYAAIDEVKDEIIRELTSRKKKTLRLFRRGGAQIKSLIKGLRDAGGRGWKRIRGK
jgi:putative sigma-54 modulation protein